MFRIIRASGLGAECLEGDRQLFKKSISGVIEEVGGARRITRTGGFWNTYVYEFADDLPYRPFPPEPRLTWRLGFIRKERFESEGFSGVVSRERVLDQVMIRAASFEWRFDLSQRELYFDPPAPHVELRTTVLAFNFSMAACQNSDLDEEAAAQPAATARHGQPSVFGGFICIRHFTLARPA